MRKIEQWIEGNRQFIIVFRYRDDHNNKPGQAKDGGWGKISFPYFYFVTLLLRPPTPIRSIQFLKSGRRYRHTCLPEKETNG